MRKGLLAFLATGTAVLVSSTLLLPEKNMAHVISFIKDNINVLIALFAAIATWQAALQAAKSAKIAKESMERSAALAEITIKETQLFNRRNSFENRYALLLKQHAVYHNQVCDYIDKKEPKDSFESVNNPYTFFTDYYYRGTLGPCHAFLTGHEIISRYMRTLYHLLKYVKDEFYDNEDPSYILKMKRYTSPLRSTIRNDVLCLIAVNALNVCSASAKKSGYHRYQQLLHDFDFFEHAVFHSPEEPNKIYGDEESPTQIQRKILDIQSKFVAKLNSGSTTKEFSMPYIQLFSPLILCLLSYENPMKNTAIEALKSLYKTQIPTITLALNRYKETHDDAKENIDKWSQWVFRASYNGRIHKVTDEFMEKTRSNVNEGRGFTYSKYEFYEPPVPSVVSDTFISGKEFTDSITSMRRYEKISNKINLCGGIDEFIKEENNRYTNYLELSLKKIEGYDVRKISKHNPIDKTKEDVKL